MAPLTDVDRLTIWRAIMRELSETGSPAAFIKPDLRAAVNTIDDWLDANAGAMNAALPQPFRSAATVAQKGFVYAYCIMKRVGLFLPRE